MTLTHTILFAAISGMLGLSIGCIIATIIQLQSNRAFDRINALCRMTRKPELEAS